MALYCIIVLHEFQNTYIVGRNFMAVLRLSIGYRPLAHEFMGLRNKSVFV